MATTKATADAPAEKTIPPGQHGGYRPNAGRKKKKPGPAPKQAQADAYESLAKAKAKHEALKAGLAELEYLYKRGQMLPKEDVEAAWTEHIHRAKNRLLSLPARLAPIVMRQEALRDVEQTIRDALLEALDELATADD